MLGQKVSEDSFTKLVALGMQITDYHDEQMGGEEDTVDDNMGVALIFDRDEGEAEEEAEAEEDDLDVVREDIMEETEGVEQEEEVVTANLGAIAGTAGADTVSPSDVDAYWLQRQLNEFTKDAEESKRLADQTLKILEVCVVAAMAHAALVGIINLV